MPRSANSTSLDDLHLAVTVAASGQVSIQHADTKAAILLSGCIGVTALVLNKAGPVATAARAGATAALAGAGLAALFVIVTLVAGWHLIRCLTPRLTGPAGRNRFALPNLAANGVPGRVPVDRQRAEAWALAVTLARIAMRKHLAIRASLPWITSSVVVSVAWLAYSMVLGR